MPKTDATGITLNHNRSMMADFEKGDGTQARPFKAVLIFGATYDDQDEVHVGWTVDRALSDDAIIVTLEAIIAKLKNDQKSSRSSGA